MMRTVVMVMMTIVIVFVMLTNQQYPLSPLFLSHWVNFLKYDDVIMLSNDYECCKNWESIFIPSFSVIFSVILH